MNETIGFEDFKLSFLRLWQEKGTIILVTLLVGCIGIFLTIRGSVQNEYGAKSTVYSALYNSYQDSVDGTTAMTNYSSIVSSTKVCERAASLLGDTNVDAKAIQRMITASYDEGSVILSIQAYSTDPEMAVKVANAVAQAFVIEMRGIVGSGSIQVLDQATASFISKSGSNKIMQIRLLFFIAGFGGICAWYFLSTLFSDTIRCVSQCTFDDDRTMMLIPYSENIKKNQEQTEDRSLLQNILKNRRNGSRGK